MKVLSFGEIIWDVYPDGQATLGGAPLNFSAFVSAFRGEVYLASSVGNDELGDRAIERIKELGINTDYISVYSNKSTGKCLVSLDKNGIPSYDIVEDTAYDYVSSTIVNQTFDVVSFGTLALRGENNKRKIKEILAANDCGDVHTDLNVRAPFYSRESIDICLSNATIVKISDEELPLVISEMFDIVIDINGAVDLIRRKYPQIRLLIVTCGAKGAYCYDFKNGAVEYQPAEKVAVVSSVGAGDSFGATFLAKYLDGVGVRRALACAAKVSAYVVAHKEAVPPDVSAFITELED